MKLCFSLLMFKEGLPPRNFFNCIFLCYFILEHDKNVKHNSCQVLVSFCVCALGLDSYSCKWVSFFNLCACFCVCDLVAHNKVQ
jgi:hypothetical protein